MLRRTLLYLSVIIVGLICGFFSEPLYGIIWDQNTTGVVQKPSASSENTSIQQKEAYITEGEAVTAVKNLSPIREELKAAQSGGAKLTFVADQEPTDDFPIWLVEIKKRYPDKVPEARYIQVDAVTGRVLDLQYNDLQIAGVNLTTNRREVVKTLGRPLTSKKFYDKIRRQTMRRETFKGLEVVYNSRGDVVKITFNRPDYPGPRGVKTGDAKADVVKMFGKAATAMTDLLEYRPLDNTNTWVVIKLDSNNRVAEISMEKAS